MTAYILRRLLLIIPTLLGIMIVNFVIVQAAPGGPVERTLAEIRTGGIGTDAAGRVSGNTGDEVNTGRGQAGIAVGEAPAIIAAHEACRPT